VGLDRKVWKILSDKKLAKKLGENGRKEAIKTYSIKVVAKKLAEVYNKALRS
jgi:glycosyltransferase involved in cell wall biosynthesis